VDYGQGKGGREGSTTASVCLLLVPPTGTKLYVENNRLMSVCNQAGLDVVSHDGHDDRH